MDRYTSIVIASHIPNKLRADLFKISLTTLFDTVSHLPVEIIVVDNGGDEEISEWLNKEKRINVYIKNSENIHFGMARNQGIAMAHGKYLCITDNDIQYLSNWLDVCLGVLQLYPDKKIYATPIDYPRMSRRYYVGELEVDNRKFKLNMRAGSNCFVIRRKDFEEIGYFRPHRIAGSKWTDGAVRKGYSAVVTPENMVNDLGIRRGYNLKESIPIARTLLNKKRIYFNEDRFRKANPGLDYYE